MRNWIRFITPFLLIGVLFIPASSVLAAAEPQVTLSAPSEVFIGESFSFTATFDNINAADVGYGPFIDIVLPATGADGAGAQTDDGITFVSADYLGVGISSVTTVTFPAGSGCVDHPLAVDATHTPLQVCGNPGDQLVVVQLPFGSFAPDQPPATVTINAQMSNLADLGTGLNIYARGGFQFGNDALDNPCCDPSIVSSGGTNPATWPPPGTATVTPTLATLTKTNNAPESETATGPNYPRTYTVTLEVAPGQTLNNVTLTDTIDNNIIVTAITPNGGTIVTPGALPFGPVNGGQIQVNYAAVSGTQSFTVTFYVPDLDANAASIINPVTGDDAVTENYVNASGQWSPLDGRDPNPTPVNIAGTCPTCPPDPDDTLADRSIAIQKGVSNFSGGDLRSGSILQYTLTFQISDYFTFGDIEIDDILSDGQRLYTAPGFAPSFSITDRSGTFNGNFSLTTVGAPTTCLLVSGGGFNMIEDQSEIGNDPAPATDGSTHLTFCVSNALITAGDDGILQGGRAILPDAGAATGTITYYTQVQDEFSDTYPSGDPSVDHGDTLDNTVTIDGTVRDNVSITTPIGTEDDGSSTGVAISQAGLTKSVYQINGAAPSGNPVHIQPGDLVTYRIQYDMPSSDFEDFQITDYLPLPIFDATTVTVFDPTASAASPPAGTAKFGPADTLFGFSGIVPGITVDAVSNSVTFSYGDFDDPGNTDRRIDILFTVQVSNDPFADGLFLTNQAHSQEGATNNAGHTEDAIVQVVLDEPYLVVTKGVVGTDNPAATFSPATTGPGSFPNVSSSQIGTTPVDSDVSNVDAGDTIDFAIVIENQGNRGAFDMVITDVLPAGMLIPAGGMNLQIQRGDGTPIAYLGADTDLFGAGIELVEPDAGGVCQSYSPAAGSNIVVITYTLEIDPAAPAGTIQNIVTVEDYANTEGGPSFIGPGETGPQDDANVTIAPDGGKVISGTSEASTGTAQHDVTLEDVTIGEVVTYTLTAVVPETGTLQSLVITDNLPAGMTSVSAVVSSIGPNIQDAGGNPPTPTITGVPGSGTVTFDFGNIRNPFNNTADDEIVMVVTARVVNAGGPTNGATLTNTMVMNVGGTIVNETVDVDVVEPNLRIVKAETGNRTTGDAGDILTFQVTVTHRGVSTADAFDVVVVDDLGAVGLELVTVVSATTNGGGTITNNSAGNVLSFHLSTLPRTPNNRNFVITYQARIADATLFEETITNTANLTYDTLPAEPGTDEREYTGSDTWDVTTSAPTIVKGIQTTSVSQTFPEGGVNQHDAGDADVAVGETVTYRVTVTMAEGTDTIIIQDVMPAVMQIESASVVSIGGNISNTLLSVGDTDVSSANITIDTAVNTNDRVTFNFGAAVLNTPDNVINANDRIVVEFVARVMDVGGNVDNADLINDADVTYTNGSQTSNQITVEVVEPVLTVTKTELASITSGDAGDIVTFRVTVVHDNATSTAPAFDVVINDDLGAAGLELVSVNATTSGGGTITDNSAGNVLSVHLDVLPRTPNNRNFVITYQARIADSNAFNTTLTNTANLTYDTSPDEPGTEEREYTGSDTYDITTTEPDIEKGIQATSLTDTFPEGGTDQNDAGINDVAIGETVTYRITVTMEEGTDTIIIRDVMPAVMRVVSAEVVSIGANISNTLLVVGDTDVSSANITIDTAVNANDRVTFNFGAAVLNTPDNVTNADDQIVVDVVAVVVDNVGNINDLDLINDADLEYGAGTVTSDDAVTVEVVEPVITMTKTFTPDIVIRGDTVTMTLFVENTGTAPAYDLQIVDTLDAFVDVTGVNVVVSDAANTTAMDNSTLTAGYGLPVDDILVDVDVLMPGESVTVTVTMVVDPSLGIPPDVVINNTADTRNITSTPGANPDERTYPIVTAPDTLTVTTPDITVNKSDSVDPVVAGQPLTYTISITNGTIPNAAATNMIVTDTLPAEFTVTLVTPSQGTCNPLVGQTLTCNVGTIAPGGFATIVIDGTINSLTPDGTVINNAVSVDIFESDAPFTDTEDTTVTRLLDLQIVKSVNDTTPNEGDLITYTLQIRNNGPANATNVTVTDVLPAGVTYVRFVPNTLPCNAAALPTITCTFPTVGVGQTRTIGIEVTVNAGTSGSTIANIGAVTSTESGPGNANEANAANNMDDATITVNQVDLAITKTVNNNAPNAPGTVVYTLTVVNNGPGNATNVVVTDNLPAVNPGVTFVSSNPAVCTEAPTDTLTCNVGNIAAGNSVVLTITANVDAGASGTLTNTASVTSDQSGAGNANETNAANNSDSEDISIGGVDLSITKVVDDPSPDAGTTIEYTLRVRNNSGQQATGVVVTDTLDPAAPGLTFVSSNPAICTEGPADTLTCNVGNLNPGQQRVIRITVQVDAGTMGQTFNNAASVTGNETDPNPTNNSANVNVTVNRIDLAITKTVNDSTPSAPGTIVYTLTVTNNGPGDATGIVVTDTLDPTVPGLTYVSANPATCTEAPVDTLTCTVPDLKAGESAAIAITVNVDGGATGTLVNAASVTANESGPGNAAETNAGNNDANRNISIGGADLSITKTVDNPSANETDTVTYTLTITNNGASDATGVVVTDTLDANLTYIGPSNPPICVEAPVDTLTCNMPGTIVAGGSFVITFDAQVDAGTSGTTLVNTASVTANEPDPDASNNTDTADVMVGAVDVAITKVVDNPTPNTGDTVTYTITVTNNGPGTANNVQVNESLPIDGVLLTYISDNPSVGTFTPNPPNSTWNVGTLANGQTETLQITVRVEVAGGSVPNTATVTTSSSDTDASNDSDSAAITLGGTDISVAKSVDDSTPDTGDTVVYTVVVRNEGPNIATNVEITDALPAGVAYVATQSVDQGTYDEISGIWAIGDLTVNQQVTLVIEGQVTANGGIIINTASLTAVDQPDFNPANNDADAPIFIGAADLELTKTRTIAGVQVGQPVRYTITVRNTGPNPATGVQVTDYMPAAITYLSSSPSQGTVTAPPGTPIVWTVGALAVGQSATLIVDGELNSTVGTLENIAEVTAAGQPDPDSTPGNGDATEDDQDSSLSAAIFDPPYGLKTFDDSGLPQIEWTMIWVNPSTVPATADIFDDIPAGTTFVAGSLQCSSPGGTVTNVCEFQAGSNRIHWQGVIAPDPGAQTVDQANNQLVIRFRVTVDGAVNRVQNVGTLTTSGGQSAATNVAVWERFPGGAPIDLDLVKSVDPPFAQPGDTVVWTIVVGNSTNQVATGIPVTDVLDTGLELTGHSATHGTVSVNGQNILWDIPVLQPGETAVLQLTTRVGDDVAVPFEILNIAQWLTKTAEARLISASELPQTGQSRWSSVHGAIIVTLLTIVISGAGYTVYRRRAVS